MAITVSVHLYRKENIPDGTTLGTNRLTGVYPKDVPVREIKRILPVNATGGEDLVGLPYLYSKIVMENPGTLQEAYVMQTLGQMHVLMNI